MKRDIAPRFATHRAKAALVLAFAALFLTPSWAPAGPPTALAIIVHADVPAQQVSRAELAAIFLGSLKEWSSGLAIKPVNGAAEEPFRVEFDRVVLKMTPQKVAQHWIDKRVRGQGTPPRELPTADLIVRVVGSTPGAIGYVPEDKVGTRTRVVARVRDGKVVQP